MAEYHITVTGNDSNNGSISSPWKTIDKANRTLQAGDTVFIHAGEYQEIISPIKSGTSGTPITYIAYPGDVVRIVGEPISHGKDICCVALGFTPQVGYNSFGDKSSIGYESSPRSYIIIDGFNISYKWDTDASLLHKFGIRNGEAVIVNEGRASLVRIENHDSVGNVIRNCKIWESGNARTNYISDFRLNGVFFGGNGVTIENNEIYGMWLGIWLGGTAPRNAVIRGNKIYEIGSNGIDIGSHGKPLIYQSTLIENNIIGPTYNEDGIQFEPWYDIPEFDEFGEPIPWENTPKIPYTTPSNLGVVIRNNVFRYCAENSIDLKGAGNVLIENNIAYGAPGQDDGGIKMDFSTGQYKFGKELFSQTYDPVTRQWVDFSTAENRSGGQGFIALGAGNISSEIIVRNNVSYDNMSTLQMYDQYKVYNNTFIGNNRDFTGPNSIWDPVEVGFLGNLNYGGPDWLLAEIATKLHVVLNFTGHVVINNIIAEHQNGEGAYNIYGMRDALTLDYNMYANSSTTGPQFRDPGGHEWKYYSFNAWKDRLNSGDVTGGEYNSKVVTDIGFVNVPTRPVGEYTSFDFSLKSTSPAKRAGAPYLTKTLSGGSGTTIRVNDAKMFCDGFNIVKGDSILVGTNSPVTIVTVVDKNTLIVNRPISWNINDGVTLESLGFNSDIGAILSTTPSTDVAPTIITQPQNQSITVGASATFQVSATGTSPLSYQWKKNGVNIPGATSSTYTVQNAVIGDNSSVFMCTVSNSIGSVNSNTAILIVADIPNTFQITQHPSNVDVSVGSNATFSVSATSDNVNSITYQWYKNNVILNGETQNTLTLTSVVSSDNSSKIKCNVSYAGTTLSSNEATLTVFGGLGTLSITVQPESQTKNVGDTATFSVTVSDPASQIRGYQWYKNGIAVGTPTLQNTFTMTNLTLADTNAKIKAAILYDDGINPLPTGTLTANTTSLPASGGYILLSWTTLNATSATINNGVGAVELVSGRTMPLYITSSQTYTLTVSNAYGTNSYSVTITVAPPIPLSIVSQPINASVMEGASATFTISATSQVPSNITYQWYRNSVAITGATSPTLNLYVVPIAYNNSQIKCSVTYGGQTIESDVVTLTVTTAPPVVKPTGTLTVTPNKLPYGGGDVVISWTMKDATTATMDWGTTPFSIPIGDGASNSIVSSTKTIKLTLVNSYGTTVLTADVTVDALEALRITTQPVDFTVSQGGTAGFSIAAAGSFIQYATYQWYKNDIAMPGETQTSLVISNVLPFDNNTKFKCVVYDGNTTVTSNTVTLFVTLINTGVNLIVNGDFLSNTDSWNTYHPDYVGFEVVDDETGKYKLGHVFIDGETTNMQFNQSGISLKPATNYIFSFSVLSENGSDFDVDIIQNGTPYDNVGLFETIDATPTFVRYSYTFTTPSQPTSNDLSDCRLRFWFVNYATKGDNYYFSNIELKEILSQPS